MYKNLYTLNRLIFLFFTRSKFSSWRLNLTCANNQTQLNLSTSNFFDQDGVSERNNKMMRVAFQIYRLIYSNERRMRDSYPYIIIILLTSIIIFFLTSNSKNGAFAQIYKGLMVPLFAIILLLTPIIFLLTSVFWSELNWASQKKLFFSELWCI